jgi:hypothetical protein
MYCRFAGNDVSDELLPWFVGTHVAQQSFDGTAAVIAYSNLLTASPDERRLFLTV